MFTGRIVLSAMAFSLGSAAVYALMALEIVTPIPPDSVPPIYIAGYLAAALVALAVWLAIAWRRRTARRRH